MGGKATDAVKSMTGFGRSQARLSDRLAVALVIRSVNHRYLDLQVRTSGREDLPEVETAVRQEVAKRTQRGRISVQVNLQFLQPTSSRYLVDREGLSSLLSQLEGLDLGEAGGASLGDLLALPGLVSASADGAGLDAEEISGLRGAVAEAVETFTAMRAEEGRKLEEQVVADLAEVETFLDWFEPQRDDMRAAVLDKLRGRIEELLEGRAVDQERLVHEAALLADRADVAEEVVRLRTHIESFRRRLESGGAIGRQLDFLCQEIHRELNTLGTKCREMGVADRVVDAKGALERIREQVQNLE